MKVALCISGDFHATSQTVSSVCATLLPTETVDIFASLWTPPDVDEAQVRKWFTSQLNARTTLRRWVFDPIRPLNEWDKFIPKYPKYSPSYFEELSRFQWGLQAVSQLKSQQESIDGKDYDAVIHIDPSISLANAPPLALFSPLLDDHVILGRFDGMPWFPSYDYGVAIVSSRNMDVYAAIQTMHRRQYLMRYFTVDLKAALVHHFNHARLKVCSVLMSKPAKSS